MQQESLDFLPVVDYGYMGPAQRDLPTADRRPKYS